MTDTTTPAQQAPAAHEVRRGETGTRPELPPLQNHIGGGFVAPTGADTLPLVDPSTEEIIAELPLSGAEDVDLAVAAAREALTAWRTTTPRRRAEILLAIADRLEEHAEHLSRLESLDTGKPRAVAADDLDMAADVFRFSAGAARSFTELGAGDYVEGHTSMLLREPVGVIGVVVPWNYPLLMAAWKIAPILAAGNTAVIKPAEDTPLTLLAFAEITAALLPQGVLNVVLGRGDVVGAALSAHEGIDMVALTGSVGSGRAVASAASDSLKRVHLELGGKAPVVVMEDADLGKAVAGLREAAFWNSGQECGAATRVLVHEDVAEQFVEQLVAEVSQIRVGTPGAGDDVEIGPLISRAHLERVRAAVDRAVEEGARIAVGGGELDGPGLFYAPTVLVDVEPGTSAAREEIFGPVITVETFSTEEEAVSRANDVVYGLAASVWTSDAARALDLPRRLDFGTVWVNSHLVLASEVPWGGFKGSGYGRDLSLYALADFSRTKHVQISHSR